MCKFSAPATPVLGDGSEFVAAVFWQCRCCGLFWLFLPLVGLCASVLVGPFMVWFFFWLYYGLVSLLVTVGSTPLGLVVLWTAYSL